MQKEVETPIAKQNSIASCTLPYPERFEAAVVYVDNLGDDADLPEEAKLLLYSLNQQATVGPCNEPRPWGWNVVSNAKWQSWRQLGDMSNMEAMRLYVRTLEEEIPDWWTPELAASWQQHQKDAAAAADAASKGSGVESGEGDDDDDDDDESDEPAPGVNGKPKPKPAPAAAGKVSNVKTTPPPKTRIPSNPTGGAVDPTRKHSSVNVTSPKSRSVAEVVVEGSWVSPFIASNTRPPPRYEHAATLVGTHLYIVGGNCGGRYLSDTWSLNLENLSWVPVSSGATKAQLRELREYQERQQQKGSSDEEDEDEKGGMEVLAALPPVAGHCMVPWGGNIVCIGGHSKLHEAPSELPVRLLDTRTGTWSLLETSVGEDEDLPRPRGGHTATLIGNKVYIFGGEDPRRKLFNELWTLDLTTLEWAQPDTTGPAPCPRSAHTAVQYRNRHIVIFGGGSVATCYDDLFVFDTQTLTWSKPEVEGPVPTPRAGHAAAVLGQVMLVVGGGNNNAGCADMYTMDLSGLDRGILTWNLVGNTPSDSAIAAEGLSLLSVPMAGCLISFGGYNGRYHNALHVYRPEGFVIVKGLGGSAQAAAGGQGRGESPKIGGPGSPKKGAAAASSGRGGSNEGVVSIAEYEKVVADLESAKRDVAAAKENVQHEVSIMRRQLDGANAALAETEKRLEGVKGELAEEQGKSMRLEVELAELRQQLAEKDELEKELSKYRQREEQEGGKKGGLWGYISGSDVAKT